MLTLSHRKDPRLALATGYILSKYICDNNNNKNSDARRRSRVYLTFVVVGMYGFVRAARSERNFEVTNKNEGVVYFRFGLRFFSGKCCREYGVVQDAITCGITTEQLRRRPMVGRKRWTFASQCACRNLLFGPEPSRGQSQSATQRTRWFTQGYAGRAEAMDTIYSCTPDFLLKLNLQEGSFTAGREPFLFIVFRLGIWVRVLSFFF